MRVGVMTCALDEVACAAFTVGAFVDLVDLYVFVDTGSVDGTPELVRSLYARAVSGDRLVVEQLGPLPDHDISIARNRALDILRERGIDYFLKIDADDVFYEAGAARLVALARDVTGDVTHVSCSNHELYQWEAEDTREWLDCIRLRRPVFWEMPFLPSHERIFAVAGAQAHGKWGDEAAGLPAEGIAYTRPAVHVDTGELLAAHYGWARPVKRKREKLSAWCGDPNGDPRVDRLHLEDDWRRPRELFDHHPEVFDRHMGQVIAWLEEQPSRVATT